MVRLKIILFAITLESMSVCMCCSYAFLLCQEVCGNCLFGLPIYLVLRCRVVDQSVGWLVGRRRRRRRRRRRYLGLYVSLIVCTTNDKSVFMCYICDWLTIVIYY